MRCGNMTCRELPTGVNQDLLSHTSYEATFTVKLLQVSAPYMLTHTEHAITQKHGCRQERARLHHLYVLTHEWRDTIRKQGSDTESCRDRSNKAGQAMLAKQQNRQGTGCSPNTVGRAQDARWQGTRCSPNEQSSAPPAGHRNAPNAAKHTLGKVPAT